MEELIAASRLLKLFFHRYTKACSAATKTYATSSDPGRDPRALDLLSCVLRELQTFSGYEADIKIAKSTLAQCRNSAPTIVPINALPPEVLIQIFDSIHASWSFPASAKRNGKSRFAEFTRPMPPIVFSHVCTHWRRIALGSPVLWSYADISTSHLQGSVFERIVDRSKVFSSRMGRLGMSLRLDVIPEVTPVILSNAIKLGRYYANTGKGLRRLQVDNWTSQSAFYSVLGSSLTSLTPDFLKQLILVEHLPAPGGILLDDAQAKAMDLCLLSITALHLIDVRLPCISRAYSGLSDLRLIASGRNRGFIINISLLTILSSSPELRIFHFNYQISFEGRASNNTTRAPLEELRELNTRGMPTGHSRLLELNSPGSKPMSLSISVDKNHNAFANYDAIPPPVFAFLERSNVVGLYIEHHTELGAFLFPSLLRGPSLEYALLV